MDNNGCIPDLEQALGRKYEVIRIEPASTHFYHCLLHVPKIAHRAGSYCSCENIISVSYI